MEFHCMGWCFSYVPWVYWNSDSKICWFRQLEGFQTWVAGYHTAEQFSFHSSHHQPYMMTVGTLMECHYTSWCFSYVPWTHWNSDSKICWFGQLEGFQNGLQLKPYLVFNAPTTSHIWWKLGPLWSAISQVIFFHKCLQYTKTVRARFVGLTSWKASKHGLQVRPFGRTIWFSVPPSPDMV